ncbi:MAG TPA: chorismate mutase [Frankiaceae bacterium]|jgi:chorismate mutase|nr:chorismate mutase [Frankiaceae bacterium]
MNDDKPSELDAARVAIDAIDAELIRLLARRAEHVIQVTQYKEQHGLAVTDPDREKRMLVRTTELAEAEGLDPGIARAVIRTIIAEFTGVQHVALGRS